MRRSLLIFGCAVALACATSAPAAAPPAIEELTRIASNVSGLKPKRKIKVVLVTTAAVQKRALALLDRDYPREQQAYDETLYRALGLLQENERLRPSLVAATRDVRGVYDPVSATLWASSSGDVRQNLLRHLVNALQDQTFGLKRVSSLRRGSRDAASAAAAAVDGSAVLFSSVVPRRMQARSAFANPRSKLFLELLRSFPVTTGVRFAASLQNVGGREAVHTALRRIPETTEQIFHVDAFLARERALPLELPTTIGAFQLRRDDTFGELDVRALLAVFQVPRLDRVGTGWGGGLSALYRSAAGQAVTLRLDWDTEKDAQDWGEAVTVLVNEAFHSEEPGFPAQIQCLSDACWTIGKRSIVFARNRARTALAIGATLSEAETIARTLVGEA